MRCVKVAEHNIPLRVRVQLEKEQNQHLEAIQSVSGLLIHRTQATRDSPRQVPLPRQSE